MLDKQTEHDEEQKKQVADDYKERLKRRQERLKSVVIEFPDFFIHFETGLFAKIAML